MIIVLKPHATEAEIAQIIKMIESFGLAVHISKGTERTIIGAIGDERTLQERPLEAFPFVEKVLPILKPYKLASREFKPEGSAVEVDGVVVGGQRVVVMAGPCAVEATCYPRPSAVPMGRQRAAGGREHQSMGAGAAVCCLYGRTTA